MGERAYLNRIKKIMELQQEADAIAAEIESLKDELKQDMTEKEAEEVTAGDYVVRYKTVTSNRLDSKALKSDLPDVYSKYTKESTSRRFTIN